MSTASAEFLIDEIRMLPSRRIAEVLDFVEFLKTKEAAECPICAKYRDPATGNLRFNAETIAAFEEGDAMLRGEMPTNWHRSIDDLNKVLELEHA